MIRIPKTLWERVRRHVEAGYPNEQCGILVGRLEDGGVRVGATREARNLVTDRAADRYEIDPRDQLVAERELCADGSIVLGYYHSHPDHPARPSETDARFAWPGYVYVIVSVEMGAAMAATAWTLRESEPRFDQVPLEIES